jgi:hypothetical protein
MVRKHQMVKGEARNIQSFIFCSFSLETVQQPLPVYFKKTHSTEIVWFLSLFFNNKTFPTPLFLTLYRKETKNFIFLIKIIVRLEAISGNASSLTLETREKKVVAKQKKCWY